MTAFLYLLPLGFIFDVTGYFPPSLRGFVVAVLLAVPLCLRPSRQAAWLAGALLAFLCLRSWVELPPLADMAFWLVLHQAVWSAMAPVPRALRAGVVAYAALHGLLFLSPLGHPVVEALTAACNGVGRTLTSQPFHLGPSYWCLGSLLLLLTLSVFSWDGTKAGPLRTAGFLLAGVLVSVLAAALLLEKVNKGDFSTSFAWDLKFRDAFGFAELGKRMQPMLVIVFPGLLYLVQLTVFLLLHFDRSAKAVGTEPAAVGFPRLGWPDWRDKRTVAALAVAGAAFCWILPPTAWRQPSACDLVFVERGVVSFTKPDYTRYGEAAGGMFGMLPEYARMFGCKAEVVKDIPEVLEPGKTLVLTNLDQDLSGETHQRIWEFVRKGGRLWILGDHTFIKNGKNHLNEILEPCHISLVNDSAQFFPQGWFNSYAFAQGTPFDVLRDDAENRPGILVGASLELGVPAVPLVVGRYGYSDMGLDEPEGDRGYLGDFKYQTTERLGDLVLVAGEVHGKGRVLVYGDTSSFFNNNLTRSFELLRASLGWLGGGDVWEAPASGGGRWLAWILVVGTAALLFLRRAVAGGAWVLGLAAVISLVGHGKNGWPDFDPAVARQRLAVLDYSHQPNASKHSAMDEGLHGVGINLLRHDKLPVAMNRWDSGTVENARYLILNAPRDPVTGRRKREIMEFMERGGSVILGCGYLDSAGCRELLDDLGCRIGGTPLGRFFDLRAFGQPVSFMSAWALDKVPANAKVLCQSPDWPLMVSVPVGKGELVLIADSEFLQNRNVEGHKNHDPANTAFLKNLLDSLEQ